MSMMLVDETKDAACKTAEADAIRAKSGGSAVIPYDWANNKGFADAIAAIPSGGGGLKYETGTFTLETDFVANSATSIKSIPHTLGVIPDVIIITPDSPDESGDPDQGYIWINKAMGEETQNLTSSASSSYPAFAIYNVNAFGPPLKSRIWVPTSASYTMGSAKMPTASDFKLFRFGSSTTWYAGTYNYFISEKWW